MRFSEHLIANSVGIWRFNETRLSNQVRIFEERTEQNTAAADKNCRVRSQIHLQLTQLVQDIIKAYEKYYERTEKDNGNRKSYHIKQTERH